MATVVSEVRQASLTQHVEMVHDAQSEGFARAEGAEVAADAVVSVKADSVWPVVFSQEKLQHGRHWCTAPQGLYSSAPLEMNSQRIEEVYF